jgi:hypothetical protein
MKGDELINKIHEWINEDVSKAQIKAVIWGIVMSKTEDSLSYRVKKERQEYEKERQSLGD